MHPLNRILALVGLKLSRVSRTAPTGRRTMRGGITRRIGGCDLLIPTESNLGEMYGQFPDYMAELARIASVVYAKYPRMIAVDVGASLGDTAAIIRSGCAAPVICIEGDRSQADALAENAPKIGDVTILQLYLSDRRETRHVVIQKAGWNSTVIPASEAGSGPTVDFHTLDEVLRDRDVSLIKLLKVDVEGFDPRVLRGAARLLREGRPVVLFEHNRENLAAIGEDNLSAFEQLRAAGYHAALVWDAYGRLLVGTNLGEVSILADLHGYVGCEEGFLSRARYLDVCAFHEQDEDIAGRCLAGERVVRDKRRADLAN